MSVLHDAGFVYMTGNGNIADPGASGTFNLNNLSGGRVVLTTTGSYTLPSPGPGTELWVTTDDTSVITLVDEAGTTFCVFTGTSGTTAAHCRQIDSNSWAAKVYRQSSTADIDNTAARVSIADAGAYTAETAVENALQELYIRTLNKVGSPVSISTAGAGTLTAAGIVNGTILRTGSSAAYTDTTATLAQILTALGPLRDGDSGYDLSWTLLIKNTVAFAETLAAGSGVSLAGQTIVPPNSTGVFNVDLSSIDDGITITGLGCIPQANVKNSQFTTIATDTTITAAAGTLTGARNVYYATTAAGAGGIALTTRTAAEMFADIPNCHIGFNWTLRIISDGGGTVTLTAPGGGGVTITGTATSATNTWRDYCCTFTTASAVTFQNVGIGTVDVT